MCHVQLYYVLSNSFPQWLCSHWQHTSVSVAKYLQYEDIWCVRYFNVYKIREAQNAI